PWSTLTDILLAKAQLLHNDRSWTEAPPVFVRGIKLSPFRERVGVCVFTIPLMPFQISQHLLHPHGIVVRCFHFPHLIKNPNRSVTFTKQISHSFSRG